MGFILSKEKKAQAKKNKEIEEEMQRQQKEDNKIIKLLLLGKFSANVADQTE